MAEYVMKNGVLRRVTGVYQCKEELVEGVDYEVFRWLYLYTPSDTTQVPTISINKQIEHYLMAEIKSEHRNFIETTINGVILRVYSSKGSTTINQNNSYFTKPDDVLRLDFDKKIASIGTSTTNLIVNKFKFTRNYNWIQGSSPKIMGFIEIDGERFVPSKLLQSIRAKNSSDKKTYNKGKCGLVSLQTKIFYPASTIGSVVASND